MFCEKEKKSKCPKKKFSKCKEGKKNVSVEFRVFGKKNGNWKKSFGKKMFLGWKFFFLGEEFC